MNLIVILVIIFLLLVIIATLDFIVRSISIKSKIKFDGAHVMITGGSSGIGLALAKKCARLGSNVTIVARNKLKLATSKGEIEQCLQHEKQQVQCVSADICGDIQKLQKSLDEACGQLGPVNILVNCAGYAICGSFLKTPPEGFQSMMQTNYMGSVYVTKAILPSMIRRKHGHVVFVSSMGGQMAVYGYSAYTPSKYAVRGLAEVLFSEVKPYNIGVSLVFPPDTDTPGYENENKTKPEATKLISETSGLFSSDHVAQRIIEGIQNRHFHVSCGFDGRILSTLSCGTAPASSLLELLAQIFLMGPLRFIMTCYTIRFDMIIRKCSREAPISKQKKDF